MPKQAEWEGAPGWGGGTSPRAQSWSLHRGHHVLTRPCFSFRDIDQFFPEDSALGGHRVPGPWFVQFAAECWVHFLQQRQQPLPDVPGADGCVHLEWAQRSVPASPGLCPPGSLSHEDIHTHSRTLGVKSVLSRVWGAEAYFRKPTAFIQHLQMCFGCPGEGQTVGKEGVVGVKNV